MERKTGFEPVTLSLARRCSTTEPLPPAGTGSLYQNRPTDVIGRAPFPGAHGRGWVGIIGPPRGRPTHSKKGDSMSAEVGDKAPDFTLPSSTGKVSLSELKGKAIVIGWFPAAFTGG